MTAMIISLIVVAAFATVALGYIWWKTSQIKKEAKLGIYVTKKQKQELKKQGISVRQYKKEAKEKIAQGKAVKEVKSHEDYMEELRRMG